MQPPHLNCVAALPCKIRKFKITVECLLLPSKLITVMIYLIFVPIRDVYAKNDFAVVRR